MASRKAISRLLEAAEDQEEREEVKSIGEREREGSWRKAEQNKEGEGNHHYARARRASSAFKFGASIYDVCAKVGWKNGRNMGAQ